MSLDFYRAFEDRHRGTRESILERQRIYLPFLLPLAAAYPGASLVDVGCGRGEWLELLQREGIPARGVDLDEGMLAACRERHLEVQQGDALGFLRQQPDASLIAVTGFHVAEHLPVDVLQALVQESLRVLRPGGLLVLETPNAENLIVGTVNFYLDPTHLRPLPPLLLEFMTEDAGFARARVIRLQEAPALHARERLSLLDVLGGVSPDYAVVAQKAHAPAALASLDALFGAHYGLTLNELAERYDGKLKEDIYLASVNAAEANVNAAEAKVNAAEAKVNAAEAKVNAAEALIQAEQARTGSEAINEYAINLHRHAEAQIEGLRTELQRVQGGHDQLRAEQDSLGQALRVEQERGGRMRQEVADLRHEVAISHHAAAESRHGVAESRAATAELRHLVAELRNHVSNSVEAARSSVAAVRDEVAAERAAIAQQVHAAVQRSLAAEHAAAVYQQQIVAMYASRSWRVTAPMRAVFGLLRSTRDAAMRRLTPERVVRASIWAKRLGLHAPLRAFYHRFRGATPPGGSPAGAAAHAAGGGHFAPAGHPAAAASFPAGHAAPGSPAAAFHAPAEAFAPTSVPTSAAGPAHPAAQTGAPQHAQAGDQAAAAGWAAGAPAAVAQPSLSPSPTAAGPLREEALSASERRALQRLEHARSMQEGAR